MEKVLDNFFLTIPEPHQSALLYIRSFFINEIGLVENWKFNTPFYYHKNKWFCYISYHPKTLVIYIGFVKGYKIEHKKLLAEGRKQIKVYYINPEKDINVKELTTICKLLKKEYK